LTYPEFYVDGRVAFDALREHGQFNAVDRASALKADFIIRKSRPFSEEEFRRRTPAVVADVPVMIATAEDIIISKLECHGSPKAYDVPPPPPPPGILAMRVYANPSGDAQWSGFCPKTLHFNGEVTYQLPPGGHAVNLTYRYVATRGAQVVRSDTFTTTFATSGKKILHVFNLDFPFSTGQPTLKAPSGPSRR
jgi:hypothetical protein